MAIDIAKFDDQLIDVVTIWLSCYGSGMSLFSPLGYASSVLPEPSESEWRKTHEGVHEGTLVTLLHLLERVPSDHLKLVVDAFQQGWEHDEGGLGIARRLRVVLDTLWQQHDPATKPIVTRYDDIFSLLGDFSYAEDDSLRAESRAKLLSLGHHLIPYLLCALMNGHAHTTSAVFSLFRAIPTEGTIKNLLKFAQAGKDDARSKYGEEARAVLDEFGISYK